MSRMFDRFRTNGFVPVSEMSTRVGMLVQREAAKLKPPVVFEVSNVAYYYATTERDDWKVEDFPGLVPPFPLTWMEHIVPSEWHFPGGRTERIGTGNSRYGYLCRRSKREDLLAKFSGVDDVGWQEILGSDAEWVCEVLRFIEVSKGNMRGPLDGLIIGVRNDGSMAEVPDWEMKRHWDSHMALGMTDFIDDKEYEIDPSVYHPWMLATSFLNCKNVEVEDNEPMPKASKRHQRKKGLPLVTYKTLRIEPFGVGRRRSGGSGTGRQTSAHIVRGHFKTFTPEKKLFGRHVGTYWWESQLRGSAEVGTVHKDYEVEAPA